MKFKLDENLPFSLKKIIEFNGNHHVDSVFHEGLAGIDDKNLIKHCFNEKRVLITLDNDFIHSHITKNQQIFGIIFLKPSSQGKKSVNLLFQAFIENYDIEKTEGKTIIVESNQIRIQDFKKSTEFLEEY